MKKRNLLWDNYKGVLIFLVVFGHFLYAYAIKYNGSLADDIFTLIYLFHMPAFIFASGYFSKSDNARSGKSLIKLLLYYLVFNTGMMFFLYIFKGTSINLLQPYNSYWYILSLIAWRIGIKELSKIKGIVPISFIIALLLGFWPEFGNVLSIRRTIAFFPFFLLGYKFSENRVEEVIKNKTKKKEILNILLVGFVTVVLLFIVNNYDITLSMLLMGKYKVNFDILYRVLIFGISLLIILLLLLTMPNKEVPFLTKLGKNSLLVYLVHRFITIIYVYFFKAGQYNDLYILYGLVASIITCWVLGFDFLNKFVANIFNGVADRLTSNDKKFQYWKTVLMVLIILVLMIKPCKKIYDNYREDNKKEENEIVEVEPNEDLPEEDIDNTIRISYVGDLILLKDQVTSAYDKDLKGYDFKPMFEYTKSYLESADYAVGVLEGPIAGSKVPYSTSNYGDGIKLYLNFPDEFAEAIKWSGIDLVTTANNHLLDRGKEGALRTLDVLDEVGLQHIGSYRNQEEKDKLTIVEIDGVKIAFLSYLTGSNYYTVEDIVDDMPYITAIMPKENTKYYKKLKEEIEEDFKQAKEANVDLIVVTAHMGSQFSHSTNNFQDKWNNIFIELGADIILGDHPHAVQPIEYKNDTLIINCPGNFANSYVKHDGDATAIVNIYIDKDTKKVVASSVVPMYTQEMSDGYYRALPIYEIMNNEELYQEMSEEDLKRIESVQKIVTKVMIGEEKTLEDVQKEYYFMDDEFYENSSTLTDWNPEYKDKEIFKLIDESESITFIGDSITEGTKNGYVPWFIDLMDCFSDKEVHNISKGGYTTKRIVKDYKQEILDTKSDLYIIAIGTNDVRYRNEKTCAMTSEAYIDEIKEIIKIVKDSNKDAKIVLISPWMTLKDDNISKLKAKEKDAMIDEYSNALEEFANENKYSYINPNPYLREYFKNHDYKSYMIDAIHPNSTTGITLYSKAIFESSK